MLRKTIKIAHRYNKNQGCLEKKILELNKGNLILFLEIVRVYLRSNATINTVQLLNRKQRSRFTAKIQEIRGSYLMHDKLYKIVFNKSYQS